MSKLTLLAAAGAGYVLGARAGRERYDQIKLQAQKVARNPRVQDAAHQVQDTAATQAAAAAGVVKEKVTDAASTVADKARRDTSIQPAP